jgi:hypothetical protein
LLANRSGDTVCRYFPEGSLRGQPFVDGGEIDIETGRVRRMVTSMPLHY